MRCIGMWTMVLVLASLASAESPLQPPPIPSVTQDPATNSFASSQEFSFQGDATSPETETLSAEAKGSSDSARAVNDSQTINAADITSSEAKAPAASSSLAAPTTAEVPPTIENPDAHSTETVVDESFPAEAMPSNRSITSRWLSGTPSAAENWYGQLDFLYWKTSNPHPSGSVFETYSVGATSKNLTNSINLNDVHAYNQMGFRALLGRNLTDQFGVELGGLWVYHSSDIRQTFSQPSTISPITGTPSNPSIVYLAPTQKALGEANMSFRNRYWSTEMNGRWHLIDNTHWTVDAIGGVRYFDYAERLAFAYNINNPATPAGSMVERFETNNHMIGGQTGSDIQLALLEYVSLSLKSRLVILGNIQDVTVKGPPAGMGEFTNASNLGSHNTGAATTLLEMTPAMVFHLTPDITFQAGYTIIWMNNILRSSNQLDLNQVGQNPLVSFKRDDLFISGLTFSLTANW